MRSVQRSVHLPVLSKQHGPTGLLRLRIDLHSAEVISFGSEGNFQEYEHVNDTLVEVMRAPSKSRGIEPQGRNRPLIPPTYRDVPQELD